MGRLLGIAGIQMKVQRGVLEPNLVALERQVAHIARHYPFVQLVLGSELSLYGDGFSNWRDIAEPIPGPLTARLGQIAQRHELWLIPGSLYERAGEAIYNTAVVFSPRGELVATYRKIFPWQPLERVNPGRDFCVFEIPGIGRMGLCICYDMWFPEVCRTLAWMGAEVILHPTLTATADREQEQVLARANAIFNQCFFIDINGIGAGGIGRSAIIDPHGRVLQQAGELPLTLIEMLDLDLVGTVREYGTAGLNQHLKQLKDFPHPFPPYEKGLAQGAGFKNLGPVKSSPASNTTGTNGAKKDRPLQ